MTDPAEAKAYADYSLTSTIGSGISGTMGGAISNQPVDDSAFGNEHSSEWDRNIQVLTPFYNSLMLNFQLVPDP